MINQNQNNMKNVQIMIFSNELNEKSPGIKSVLP